MRLQIILIVATGAAVFAALGLVPSDHRATEAESVAAAEPPPEIAAKEVKEDQIHNDDRIDQLSEEVHQLKEQVDRLSRALRTAQAQLKPLDLEDASDPVQSRREVDFEESFPAAGEEPTYLQAELEQRFAAEMRDTAWGDQIDLEFQTALERLSEFGLKDTKMVYQECRATLCNAEFIHGEGEDPRLLAAALAIPGIERITVVPDQTRDGESAVSKLYFFREGFGAADSDQ
jgi:hypothetical protein